MAIVSTSEKTRVRDPQVQRIKGPAKKDNVIGSVKEIGGTFAERAKEANKPPSFAGPTDAFFNQLLGNRLRTIETFAGANRQAATQALEARGLGQSSVLGQAFGEIGRNSQLAAQQGQSAVQALRFQDFQSEKDFQREVYLTKLRADVSQSREPWWQPALGALPGIGLDLYKLGAFGGGGGGGNVQTDVSLCQGKFGA
jgi:hypothetical protein